MNLIPNKKMTTFFIVLLYFIIGFTYSYLRYIEFGKYNFLDDANFIINKAFTIVSVLSISTSYLISIFSKAGFNFFKKKVEFKRYFGLTGFYFICFHVFFAVRLIKPSYMPQFYDINTEIAVRGQLVILLGIVAFLFMLFPAVSSIGDIMKKLGARKWLNLQRMGYYGFFVVMLHSSLIGFDKWGNFESWQGGMPPITLLMAMIILFVLVMRLFIVVFHSKK